MSNNSQFDTVLYGLIVALNAQTPVNTVSTR